jgi:hypothetical protein
MYRIGRIMAMAAGLLLIAAGPVAATSPEIFRDSGGAPMGPNGYWSYVCGAEIQLAFRYSAVYTSFGDTYDIHWNAQTTLVGPGGTLIWQRGYSFGGPALPEVVDPDTGAVTVSLQETTRGTRTLIELGTGRLFQDVGLQYDDMTITYFPDDTVDIVVHESFFHGQDDPLSQAAFEALVCDALLH